MRIPKTNPYALIFKAIKTPNGKAGMTDSRNTNKIPTIIPPPCNNDVIYSTKSVAISNLNHHYYYSILCMVLKVKR